jgi:thiol-disulfide isomerase/thioredoxin
VVRNIVLGVLAVFLVGGPNVNFLLIKEWADTSVLTLLGVLAMLILAGVSGWVLMHIVRQQGRLLLRIEALETQIGGASTIPSQSTLQPFVGLSVGSLAPEFRATSTSGSVVSLEEMLGLGKQLVLLFMEPECGPCSAFAPELAHWHERISQTIELAIVTRGNAKNNREKFAGFGADRILLQNEREIAEAYHCPGTPGAVLIRADGTIGSPVAAGAQAIRELLGQADLTKSITKRENIHDLELLDLNGAPFKFNTLIGETLFLLFWNPGCGFCTAMVEDLRMWENAEHRSLKLIMIASGSAEQNRALGLRSLVLLDSHFATAAAFGAGGTPSGIVISQEGTVVSALLVGAESIMATLWTLNPTVEACL